jgi:GDP/UDP-N,N'-diacetylbacillosamine 2-epimerase (hydrolysing)
MSVSTSGRARLLPSRRRVAVVTGTRSEYGALHSVMTAIAAESRLELQIVVTGMHLLPQFGRTEQDIARDGWQIAARAPMQKGDDDQLDQARGLARGVAGIAEFLAAAHTDIVVVLGDRIEAMAGALAAVTTGRVLAHIHGGDVAAGDFDDSLRHAITKLAHLHFAATRRSAQRIIRMGERREHVYVVGAPGLDRVRELMGEGNKATRQRGNEADCGRAGLGTALVVYHASGRTPAVEERGMTAVLNAVEKGGLRRLIVYPNTDRGHTGVLRAIRRHAARCGRNGAVKVARSLARDDYLRALLAADVLVGNSSSGIIEAPLAGTPSVDVGARQAGRQAAGPSVVHAAENEAAIRAALRKALRSRPRLGGRNAYGDGQAGPRIARILAQVELSEALLRKQITY